MQCDQPHVRPCTHTTLYSARMQLEVRASDSGEVLMREQLPQPVVSVLTLSVPSAALRHPDPAREGSSSSSSGSHTDASSPTPHVLVCLADGEVRGYAHTDAANMSEAKQAEADVKRLEQVRCHAELQMPRMLHVQRQQKQAFAVGPHAACVVKTSPFRCAVRSRLHCKTSSRCITSEVRW